MAAKFSDDGYPLVTLRCVNCGETCELDVSLGMFPSSSWRATRGPHGAPQYGHHCRTFPKGAGFCTAEVAE